MGLLGESQEPYKKEVLKDPPIPEGFRYMELQQLGFQHCRFPTGDKEVKFCGCQVSYGPYCQFHAKIAYQSMRQT